MQRLLNNETETAKLAAELAVQYQAPCTVHLRGDLGAGKTTLVRHWLRALGYIGIVKSPTYTLIEPYQIADQRLFHLDLYRLTDPYELELLGLRDILAEPTNLLFIEWPEKGEGVLPRADLVLQLEWVSATQRRVIF